MIGAVKKKKNYKREGAWKKSLQAKGLWKTSNMLRHWLKEAGQQDKPTLALSSRHGA